jgi:hypothetical protein
VRSTDTRAEKWRSPTLSRRKRTWSDEIDVRLKFRIIKKLDAHGLVCIGAISPSEGRGCWFDPSRARQEIAVKSRAWQYSARLFLFSYGNCTERRIRKGLVTGTGERGFETFAN